MVPAGLFSDRSRPIPCNSTQMVPRQITVMRLRPAADYEQYGVTCPLTKFDGGLQLFHETEDDGGHRIPSSPRHCTSVLIRSTTVGRRSAVETPRPAALVDLQSSRRPPIATCHCRSFAAAGPRLWNSLAVDVQSAPSLSTFRQKLKTHLLRQSYPDVVL